MSAGDGPQGYDEVRRALLTRGYLETPLERLFLGGLGDPLGRSLRRRLLSALLAGAIAGPLLALLLAGVLVLEGRGLVPAWPDGVLYFALFAPVLGVFVALAEAVAGAAIRALARVRPGLSPRRASIAVALAVAGSLSLYLGIWWVRAGGRASARDLLGLLVLAAGAGFAGRVVSAAALVQAALAMGRAPLDRRPRFATIAIGGAVLAAGIAALAAQAFVGPRVERDGAAVTVDASAPRRALLVAWDGLGWELARGLERVADPSSMTFLRAHSERGVLLAAEAGADPVATWATVATGCPPALHGATSLELQGLRGANAPVPRGGLAAGPLALLTRLWPTEPRVVRAGVRQVPALWEVTAAARKTAVIGWWGTWPAAAPGAQGGYVVSDRAIVAIRLQRGVGESLYPAAWGEVRGPRWLDAAETRARQVTGAEPGIRFEALVGDLFALEALGDALADPEVGTATVYLPGLDILRDQLGRAGKDPFEILEAVQRHAAAVDRRLSEVAGWAALPQLSWLVALPGRTGAGERGFLGSPAGALAAADAALGGTAPAAGPGVAAPAGGPVAATVVAPTFLAAAGYPVDSRMAGEVLPAGRTGPVRRVRTAAAPVAAMPVTDTLDADFIERLRSLGYVK